ncbi:flavin reductase family protein [Aliiruegeria lutimaris]|uniref:Flavin reductase n=1 Tax=Aliiruegeria lutimaris TaxID=571298 RepID=A0A1G9GV90_9RHOB|nr:flavin reductase family protein [Aliiruegeria lutimaris]SDL04586.1 flavin reductase [Aliiruegeria lutimaris]
MPFDHIETGKALRSAFLDAMSRVAATVSVVTTDGVAGRVGTTVSAMTSVSADGQAPVLLICLHKNGNLGHAILKNGTFCVNVLGEDQAWISNVFAGRHKHEQPARFDAVTWEPMVNGSPGLKGVIVRFACNVLSSQCVGTHDVIFGSLTEISGARGGAPLVYANRAYSKLETPRSKTVSRSGRARP